MNPAQLGALFAAHKTAILGGGAAAVAGLALLQKRKKTTGTAAAASTPAGTIPAAAVVPATGTAGGVYDSGNVDLFSALQPELEAIRQTQGGGITSAPAPVASAMFGPSGTGNYVRYGNGRIGEVESDGSLLGLVPDQWNRLAAQGATFTSLAGNEPAHVYTTADNLSAKGA